MVSAKGVPPLHFSPVFLLGKPVFIFRILLSIKEIIIFFTCVPKFEY